MTEIAVDGKVDQLSFARELVIRVFPTEHFQIFVI